MDLIKKIDEMLNKDVVEEAVALTQILRALSDASIEDYLKYLKAMRTELDMRISDEKDSKKANALKSALSDLKKASKFLEQTL